MPRIPRPPKKGDAATTARKRYQREAARQLKAAESSTGETSARHRATAKTMLNKAIDTYAPGTKPKFTKEIRSLSDRLNVDLDVKRAQLSSYEGAKKQQAEEKRTRRIESSEVLAKDVSDERRAEEVARMLVTDSHITSRIIGGFEKVWKKDPRVIKNGKVNKKQIFKSIMRYLKVKTFSELLEKLEAISGMSKEELYDPDDSEVIYETVKLLIQASVMEDATV